MKNWCHPFFPHVFATHIYNFGRGTTDRRFSCGDAYKFSRVNLHSARVRTRTHPSYRWYNSTLQFSPSWCRKARDRVHHFNRLGSRELPPPAFYGTSKGQGTMKERAAVLTYSSPKVSLFVSSRKSPPFVLTFVRHLRPTHRAKATPLGGIWKVFAVQFEERTRGDWSLKTPGINSHSCFFIQEEIFSRRAPRARARIKRLFNRRCAILTWNFFSTPHMPVIYSPATVKRLNLLERFLTSRRWIHLERKIHIKVSSIN